jgi:hypothetical protein
VNDSGKRRLMSVQMPPAEGRRGPSTARAAAWANDAALAATMGRAFLDDPFVSYLVPGHERRARKLPVMFALLYRLARGYNACDVTANAESAATWRAPGASHVPLWQYVTNGPRLLGIFGGNTLRALAAMDMMERRHPREPHWYLQAIGTDPAFQGTGGGVLLRHRRSLIDAAGCPPISRPARKQMYRSMPISVSYLQERSRSATARSSMRCGARRGERVERSMRVRRRT